MSISLPSARSTSTALSRAHRAVLLVAAHSWLAVMGDPPALRRDRESGQATTEYALVLLAAASIALVLVAWATKGGKLTRLFDAVVDQLIGKAK